MSTYEEWLARKAQLTNAGGFEPIDLPDHLFPFQCNLVEWAVRQGRGAIFADCGMGKTPMSLAWADQVVRKSGRPVLFLTPLAVGFQVVNEAEKFGHDAAASTRPSSSPTTSSSASSSRPTSVASSVTSRRSSSRSTGPRARR